MRWFNTVQSHPNVAEFLGPIAPAPVTSSASSSAAPHSATNGIAHGQAARGGEASTSQSGSQPASSATGTAASQPDGQQGRSKPKGKDAKGGKLAKNDVAKGQKKGGDKKDKPSQAPKGDKSNQNEDAILHSTSLLKCCLHLTADDHTAAPCACCHCYQACCRVHATLACLFSPASRLARCNLPPPGDAKKKKKETKLGLAHSKQTSFGDWYSEVVVESEMISYYDVSGAAQLTFVYAEHSNC